MSFDPVSEEKDRSVQAAFEHQKKMSALTAERDALLLERDKRAAHHRTCIAGNVERENALRQRVSELEAALTHIASGEIEPDNVPSVAAAALAATQRAPEQSGATP